MKPPTVRRWAVPLGAALALSACSGSKPHQLDCRAFEATSAQLTAERDAISAELSAPPRPGKASEALLEALGDTSSRARLNTAERTLAEFYVRDQTGCASVEDKARAQATLDSLQGQP